MHTNRRLTLYNICDIIKSTYYKLCEAKINNYDNDVIKHWGNTDAYKEYSDKTQHYSKEKWARINEGLMLIFAEFAECLKNGENVTSDAAQSI